MADKRPAGQKPKGSGNPNRINRLLVKKATTDYKTLSNMVVLSNLRVNSEQNSELRLGLRETKTRFRMVRNRLTLKAFTDLGLKDGEKLFQGATCIVDSDDPVQCAKIAIGLAEKYNKSLKVVGGLLEGKLLTAKEVEALAKSKSKPELLSEVVGMTRGPGSRIAAALKGPGGRIAGAIKALVEKLEKAEPVAAAAEAAPAPEAPAA